MNRLFRYVALLVVSGPLAGAAFAGAWEVQRFTQEYDKQGSATEDFVYSGVLLRTTDTTKPELRFGCSKRYGLTATVTFEPIAEKKPDKNSRVKMRTKRANLKIEGQEPEHALWTVVKETRTVQARSSKTAAMMYNAAVMGKSITIDEPYKSEVTLELPAPDEDFNVFVRSCHVTNGS